MLSWELVVTKGGEVCNTTNTVGFEQAETVNIFLFGSREIEMSVFGRRLKFARLSVGLSQEALGIQAGLEVESASARMNRYEKGTRVPALELVERIGAVLNFPVAYFYSVDDDEARLLLAFHRMPAHRKNEALAIFLSSPD